MFNKTIRGLVAAALVATGLMAVNAAPAQATAGPLDCNSTFYQVSGGKMYSFDPTTGIYTLMPGTGSGLNGLNGIGYNPADHYIYGVAGDGKLHKVLSDGSFDAGVSVSGVAPQNTAGDFIAPNKLLTMNAGSSWTLIDLTNSAAPSSSTFTVGTGWAAYDFAYYPSARKGYGMNASTLYIATFNAGSGVPTSATVATKTVTASPSATLSGSWGASYMDAAGDAFFFNNGSSKLYEITAASLATASPVATLVASPSSLSTPNDGASCNTASSPFAPNVVTQAATGVNDTDATLPGTVSTTGATGSDITTGHIKICWSTSNAATGGVLNDTSNCTVISDVVALSTSNHAVSWPLTSTFTAGTTYFFQVQATNSGGQLGFGEIKSFQTTSGGVAAADHTVTFYGNNSTGGSMDPQTTNVRTALNTNAFTKTGYNFDGWNTQADGQGTDYADGVNYDFTADLSLYAQWTVATIGTYTVQFDNNGGSGSMSNQTGSSSANLHSNAFSRNGYNFTGWNTAADGSGDDYTNGASYPFNADVTMYAQWAPASYNVNFNSQGGNQFPSSGYSYGGCVALPGAPVRAGYTFVGWFVAPDAHSLLPSPYCPGGTGDITLYAHWTANQAVLHYDSQGGSSVADTTYTPGSSVNLAGAPTRDGYTFGGWAVSPGDGATVNSPYTPAGGNVTLYAHWTKNAPATAPLNFDPQGGSSVDGKNYKAGDCIALPTTKRDGYVLAGWSTSANGAAVANPYCPTGLGPITLYALWTPASHAVNFNSQGGSAVAGGNFTTGGCVNLPAAPTRDGYTFDGWFTDADGGSAVANPYCPTGLTDLSLFAHWTKTAVAPRGPITVVISGFADGKSKLTYSMKKKIDAFLTKFNDYKYIQCVGFTEGPTVLSTDKALSKARASVSCAYALAGLGQGLTAKPVKSGNETTEAAQLRRVEITLSDN